MCRAEAKAAALKNEELCVIPTPVAHGAPSLPLALVSSWRPTEQIGSQKYSYIGKNMQERIGGGCLCLRQLYCRRCSRFASSGSGDSGVGAPA